jgi:hypothetical protein
LENVACFSNFFEKYAGANYGDTQSKWVTQAQNNPNIGPERLTLATHADSSFLNCAREKKSN